ncbi:DUF4388 domain-containing protein [Gloeocapsa sp. PCC 73106]|uniref:DUF4388 domain-containing protein n=1 Tax=Gloeocapsa sp. PCC 73106 TaxID=102232 RepID=UPI0005534529|nr:DUF4388 domain-containing protein [Gloeocapsa sp. PCC 73106]
MSLNGYLSQYSLPELFQLIQQGQKTGRLTLSCSNQMQHANHYIWFSNGAIVAAANQLNQDGLASMIEERKWLKKEIISTIARICATNTPIGLYLKGQNLLNAEQLKILFYLQVMRQVCELFKLKEARFYFDNNAPIPMAEMTGLSSQATEITLEGLRVLKDWSALTEKLPTSTSGIVSIVKGYPKLSLNKLESRVWEYTDGKTSLSKIAKQLNLPIEQVQQIAFRLVIVNLAQEVPVIVNPLVTTKVKLASEIEEGDRQSTQISRSFVQDLLGFLSKCQ